MKIVLILLSDDIYGCNVRTLSSVVKSHGHDVKLFFVMDRINKKLTEQIVSEIGKQSPDVVGLSIMSDVSFDAKIISEAIRNEIKSPILWGGIHTTINSETCLKYADYVFIGEADETLPAFLDAYRPVTPFVENGVISRWDPEGRIPSFSAPLQDLDSLPFQDIDWEDHTIFHNGNIYNGRDCEENLLGNAFHAMMSRGCPMNCTFCYNNYLRKGMKDKGKYFREMSDKRIIDEITAAKRRYSNMKRVTFWDDNFIARNTGELSAFTDAYIKEIGLPFNLLANPANITEEKLAILKKAGLDSIHIGLQSGSENTNKSVYRRPISREKTLAMFDMISKMGIMVAYDIIFNNPYETIDNLKESIDTILHVKRPYLFFGFNLVFIPGTELYDRAIADGLISEKNTDKLDDDEPMFSKDNTPIHNPLNNKPSSRFYNIHYASDEKRYYNLLLFLVVGSRIIPHSLVRFLLNHRNSFTENIPPALTALVMFVRKTRRIFRSIFRHAPK